MAENSADAAPEMKKLGVVLADRGSRYAVTGARVTSRAEVDAVLAALKTDRAYAKATHNTWAAMLPTGALKADDGESGAGMVILRMMEREGLQDHLIIVTRWYGGKKLGGDRFRRVQDAVRAYLNPA
ncbi:YigZ family protein [Phaeobacter gallaeciensis]|uniref:YigZ family protein n=1 Tax=Phaeobacter gallaeciensis TaxID=60890 RepID=UPI00237FAB5C|nr:YigZ family protein [Phaeobacter gallaeciensis]MDE4191706.1 YigZ family protein [Phaeobacter gallaeciensis]MDE4200169.1 YigZ family protein [Phaeobacter gallaeciensis]MDE4204383.1 YigZ family protein [Phaeobacter gallaeciensis]MDE4208461.1 YigZ family protein [Phaeobacter gallaeciensis]MDE4216892.1 YigZ family protein [Phaeobacter gallaeciensis]